MMKRLFVLVAALVLAIADAQPAFSQASDELKALRRDMESLREGQTAIQKQLQEIQTLLRGGRPASPTPESPSAVLDLDGAPFKGDKSARVTLVEFADYQCPFCVRYARDTFPEIEREYIKTGRLKYVFRDFPIETIHPGVSKAHEAAHCAGDQAKYWEMHDRLLANPKAQQVTDLVDHAKALALEMPSFEQCLSTGGHTARVRRGLSDGQQAGARGTPTFFLGLTEANSSKITTSRMLVGAQPYAAFKQAIESLLAESPHAAGATHQKQ
jgi:protein-disulfide isomerase